jgi:hypothetical protein
VKFTTKIVLAAAGTCFVLLIISAFRPPVPLERVRAIKPGMTETEVRQILGEPTKIYRPFNHSMQGTNYTARGQWTYIHPLRFGFVNVHWETNGTAMDAHYEEF